MPQQLSRRKFMQLAGVAAAATSIAPHARLFAAPAFLQASKTLSIGINAWMDSLDPHASAGPSNVGGRMFGLMFDGLIQLGRDGEAQLQPQLATSWENDGNVWRFMLRDGVRFQDGSTMSADDVVASFNRMIDPALTGSFGSARLAPFMTGIEKIDDSTVEITTVGEDQVFPYRIAFHQVAVMPKAFLESADAETLRAAPIGAGPYKVVEFATDHLVLEAHNDYWMGRPAADQVTLRYVPENATRVGALQSGELDLITNVPFDQLNALEADSNFAVASTPLQNYMSVLLNTTTGPLMDVNLRRALSLAIDREAIVNDLLGGRFNLMNDYLLPGTFGYDPDLPPLPYDPEAAAAALAASSYAGEPIHFTPVAGYYVNSELYSPVINDMWNAIGVNTNFEPQEIGAYIQMLRGGTVEAGIQSWGGTGDAILSLYISWAQPGIYQALYTPPAEFNTLYSELTTTIMPDADRYAAIRRITNMWFNDVPTIPLFQSADFFGMRSGITFQAHPEFFIDLRPENFSM